MKIESKRLIEGVLCMCAVCNLRPDRDGGSYIVISPCLGLIGLVLVSAVLVSEPTGAVFGLLMSLLHAVLLGTHTGAS
jgi:hypothetical protein